MNSRQLLLLTVAVLAVVGGAIWIGSDRSESGAQEPMLYPALKGELKKVTTVNLFKAGDQLTVELTRDDSTWHVKQRHDYPADNSRVNALLLDLESARIVEQKTSNPANYATLHVQDLSAADASGTRIDFVGVSPAVRLIVGKRDELTRTTYVRRAGEAPSWSVQSQIDAPADPAAWLQHEALDIDAARIQSAVISIGGEASYSVTRSKRDDVNFDVTGLPKSREVNSVSAPNAIAQTLVNLQLEDVRPAAELAADKPAARTTFQTFDGLVVDVSGYAKDEKHWLIVKTAYDEAHAHKNLQSISDSDAVDKTRPIATKANVESEAQAINKKLGTWAIAVPTYKFDALFKPIEKLLRKKP